MIAFYGKFSGHWWALTSHTLSESPLLLIWFQLFFPSFLNTLPKTLLLLPLAGQNPASAPRFHAAQLHRSLRSNNSYLPFVPRASSLGTWVYSYTREWINHSVDVILVPADLSSPFTVFIYSTNIYSYVCQVLGTNPEQDWSSPAKVLRRNKSGG